MARLLILSSIFSIVCAQLKYRSKHELPCPSSYHGVGRVKVKQIEGEENMELSFCGVTRDSYASAYRHEAIVLPVLPVLHRGARQVLVLDGADGGVATQVLKNKDVEKVVIVTNSQEIMNASINFMSPLSDGFRDTRLEVVVMDPLKWITDGPLEQLRRSSSSQGHSVDAPAFDLIVVDEFFPSDSFRSSVFYQQLKSMMSPRSALVQYVDSLWNIRSLQDTFRQQSQIFDRVFVITSYSPIYGDEHGISFVAGNVDMLEPDWSWWENQDIPSILYHRPLHNAILTPSATTIRSLGLFMPSRPDTQAIYVRGNVSNIPTSRDYGGFSLPDQPRREKLYERHSKFQKIEVFQHRGYVSLFLDEDLQQTSWYGDFYHEAMVHPAMAALGRKAHRVLVIGAGDGGVTTALLRYPTLESVVQIEIDVDVVEASKRFLPEMASGYTDTRTQLIIADAIQWVKTNTKQYAGAFDLCVIDTTDNPLKSLWTMKFFQSLKKLLRPHGAIVQNVGVMGGDLDVPLKRHLAVWKRVHVISVDTPDYPSPYLLNLATDSLEHMDVDWQWWTEQNIKTVYYHPSLHGHLFVPALETQKLHKTLAQRKVARKHEMEGLRNVRPDIVQDEQKMKKEESDQYVIQHQRSPVHSNEEL